MSMQKVFGYILVAVGVGCVFASLAMSFTFFTGSATPPEIFSLSQDAGTKPSAGAKDDIAQMISGQLQQLLPANTVSTLLNFGLWSMFAGLLMFGGTQVSFIGIRLLKQ